MTLTIEPKPADLKLYKLTLSKWNSGFLPIQDSGNEKGPKLLQLHHNSLKIFDFLWSQVGLGRVRFKEQPGFKIAKLS